MKFNKNDLVEAFDDTSKSWLKGGVVVARWEEVSVPAGVRSTTYDISGCDNQGPWRGRWDSSRVRAKGVE